MKRTEDTYELSSIDGLCQVCEVVKKFRSNDLTYEVGDTVVTVYHKSSRTINICLLNEIADVIDNYRSVDGLAFIIKYCTTSAAELNQMETFLQFNEYFKPIQDLTESIQQYDTYIQSIYTEKYATIENEDITRGWLRKTVHESLDMILSACIITSCAACLLILVASMKAAMIFGGIALLMVILFAVNAYDKAQYTKIYNKYNGPIVLPYSKWKNVNNL